MDVRSSAFRHIGSGGWVVGFEMLNEGVAVSKGTMTLTGILFFRENLGPSSFTPAMNKARAFSIRKDC